MATATSLQDLKSVRHALGQSQRELAAMLGVSTRAVQSYEQGWRPMPAHVQKLAGLLLMLFWQKGHPRAEPCWQLNQCKPATRNRCFAYRTKAGQFCWMVAGTCGHDVLPWDQKLPHCEQCRVMRRWLKGEANSEMRMP